MKPEYIFCNTCQTAIEYDRMYYCRCGYSASSVARLVPIPDSWEISVDCLNPRYYQILVWLVEGCTTAEIAERLGKPRYYPKKILEQCRLRLHVRTSFELVARVAVNEAKKKAHNLDSKST